MSAGAKIVGWLFMIAMCAISATVNTEPVIRVIAIFLAVITAFILGMAAEEEKS